jgi:hypothetical protein
MPMAHSRFLLVAALALGLGAPALAQTPPPTGPPTQQTPPPVPVPKPFPGARTPPATPGKPAAPPATAVDKVVAQGGPDADALAGAPVYPGADYLDSFDAGQGQRYYIFGTNAPYEDIVTYYKNTLKTGGRELFKSPAMQQFDLGRFNDSTMAYPPSVVVKDYTWNGSAGYLHVSGTETRRYRTIIQIVPAGQR